MLIGKKSILIHAWHALVLLDLSNLSGAIIHEEGLLVWAASGLSIVNSSHCHRDRETGFKGQSGLRLLPDQEHPCLFDAIFGFGLYLGILRSESTNRIIWRELQT